ncbi:MAG: FliA/WhiG family RNA polymerase sigma factor [bacterium]
MDTLLIEWEEGRLELNDRVKDKIILQYAYLVKHIAYRIAMRLPPQVDIEDLINAGIIGLIDAVNKFDTKRGVKFNTYAESRIRGAILDELRSLDWVPRSVRQKVRKLEKLYRDLEAKLGRPAEDEEIAQAMGIRIEELQEIVEQARGTVLFSLDELWNTEGKGDGNALLDCLMSPRDSSNDPLLSCRLEEIKERTARVIEELPLKEKLVISLYYYDELTMKEIGQVINVTESRICQLHTKAVIRLRSKLRDLYTED